MRGAVVLLLVVAIAASACAAAQTPPTVVRRDDAVSSPEVRKVLESALEQTRVTTGYTQEYVQLDYPGGDLPAHTGACTDVVIRAFRAAGVDLQKEVHEDMARSFSAYPRKWGLKKPDRNIDHRRVPNLMTFFERRGRDVGISADAADYRPGDVVAWDLGGGMTHIGIVTAEYDETAGRFLIVHNIGAGTRLEDVLFAWKVIGHYRYFG